MSKQKYIFSLYWSLDIPDLTFNPVMKYLSNLKKFYNSMDSQSTSVCFDEYSRDNFNLTLFLNNFMNESLRYAPNQATTITFFNKILNTLYPDLNLFELNNSSFSAFKICSVLQKICVNMHLYPKIYYDSFQPNLVMTGGKIVSISNLLFNVSDENYGDILKLEQDLLNKSLYKNDLISLRVVCLLGNLCGNS